MGEAFGSCLIPLAGVSADFPPYSAISIPISLSVDGKGGAHGNIEIPFSVLSTGTAVLGGRMFSGDMLIPLEIATSSRTGARGSVSVSLGVQVESVASHGRAYTASFKIPKPKVTGYTRKPYIGDFTIPKIAVTGAAKIGRIYAADITVGLPPLLSGEYYEQATILDSHVRMPFPSVTGIAKIGTVVTGSILIPVFKVDGNLYIGRSWNGSFTVPIVSVSASVSESVTGDGGLLIPIMMVSGLAYAASRWDDFVLEHHRAL